ncbi:MAG: polyphosphate polymerase domain-containing protein [Clostridia bacterium]|nr:polyphosphate polymerase domain-containing protein [Clostridia bacterium]
MDTAYIFKRIEKKYLLTEEQYGKLFRLTGSHLKMDRYGRSTVMSLYLDTPDFRIIRGSIEAEDYKEKLRLRCYGTQAAQDTTVFLELKKKFDGVVYKRRVSMTLREAERYLRLGLKPQESQIMSEIEWTMRRYDRPKPAMMILCEWEAWFDAEQPDLRLTFDRDIRYREEGLSFRCGAAGIRLLPENTVLLEIKTAGAMPLWLAWALDETGIRPGSFSKYGSAYLKTLEGSGKPVYIHEGGVKNAVNF